MKVLIQALLLNCYKAVVRTGVFSTRAGQFVFCLGYRWYKQFVEAGDVQLLRRFVGPGSVVIDVGANMGFFTGFFARWVGAQGLVIAIEPEATNLARLANLLKREGLEEIVRVLPGVAAEENGFLQLLINPYHPGDHKLGDQGVRVPAFRLDDLLCQLGGRSISLVKIDVQGAEALVLAGAQTLLATFRPNLFVEIDDAALRRMGASAKGVLQLVEQQGYLIYRIRNGSVGLPLSVEAALEFCRPPGYCDFLCCHREGTKRT